MTVHRLVGKSFTAGYWPRRGNVYTGTANLALLSDSQFLLIADAEGHSGYRDGDGRSDVYHWEGWGFTLRKAPVPVF